MRTIHFQGCLQDLAQHGVPTRRVGRPRYDGPYLTDAVGRQRLTRHSAEDRTEGAAVKQWQVWAEYRGRP